MDLQTIEQLCNKLKPIKKQLELLEFWRKWPELELIDVMHTSEYNDEGSYNHCHYIEDIKFVSAEAQRALIIRCFYSGYTNENEELASYLNTEEDTLIEIDPSDWEDVLEFTSLNYLENESYVYCRPEAIELSIKELETEAQALILNHVKGIVP